MINTCLRTQQAAVDSRHFSTRVSVLPTAGRPLFLCGLMALVVLGATPSVEAGIIPWTYNAIFGPVGSTFGAGRRTFYQPGMGYGASFAPMYGGACCGGSPCNSCNTCNYGSSYGSFYGSYDYGCSSCGSGGCPGGNCSSYTPATGVTPTPATPENNNAPTPTRTFESSKPMVNPDAGETQPNSTYDENGFEKPTRPTDPMPEPAGTDAVPFNPFGSSSSESLRVPAAPMVPVPQRQPAPADLNGGGLNLPPLRFEPAPVAVDETSVTWNRQPERTRTARAVRYEIPHVARYTPGTTSPLLPPLPAPVQVVSK